MAQFIALGALKPLLSNFSSFLKGKNSMQAPKNKPGFSNQTFNCLGYSTYLYYSVKVIVFLLHNKNRRIICAPQYR